MRRSNEWRRSEYDQESGAGSVGSEALKKKEGNGLLWKLHHRDGLRHSATVRGASQLCGESRQPNLVGRARGLLSGQQKRPLTCASQRNVTSWYSPKISRSRLVDLFTSGESSRSSGGSSSSPGRKQKASLLKQGMWSTDRELPPGSERGSRGGHHVQYGDIPIVCHKERPSSCSRPSGAGGKDSGYITATGDDLPPLQQQEQPLDHHSITGARRGESFLNTRKTPGSQQERTSDHDRIPSNGGEASDYAYLPIRRLSPLPMPNKYAGGNGALKRSEANKCLTAIDDVGPPPATKEQHIRASQRPTGNMSPPHAQTRPLSVEDETSSSAASGSIYQGSHNGEFEASKDGYYARYHGMTGTAF